MSGEPYLDPLTAAAALLHHISGTEAGEGDLNELAARLDAFVYSLRFVRSDTVKYIQDTDATPPEVLYKHRYETIGKRFSQLGRYWTVSSRMIPGKDSKILLGDAIDDLSDIADELEAVFWYLEKFGRQEALAALRSSYELHLKMHLIPLRAHLEQEIFDLC